jgi:cyclase
MPSNSVTMSTKVETRTLILFVLTIFLSLPHINGQTELPQSKHYILEKLADGVYAAIHNPDGGYAICNAGIIDLGDKTVIIDPFISPSAARDLRQHAELLTGKPVSIVLNLHGHNDHTGGNQVFLPGADIISTPNARKYIKDNFEKDYEYYKKTAPDDLLQIQKKLKEAVGNEKTELTLWEAEDKALIESFPEIRMTLPNITIEDTMIIYGSKRRIVVIPTATGHTNGDMIAYLPVENIIFMSDQLFVKCHPYMGDGDPVSWKNNLKQIIALNPAIAVPGHGPVGDVSSLVAMVDYIETLTGIVNAEIKKGADEKKVMELPILEKYNDWLIRSFYGMNLKFLYQKLIDKTNPKL